MREIEFEIWSEDQKRMLPAEEVSWLLLRLDGEEFSAWEDGKIIFNHKNAKLRQYTGLKDQNGRKIFGGDIIKNDHSEDVYQVVFKTEGHFAGAFCLKSSKNEKIHRGFSQKSIWMPSDEPKNFDKVIGNIYENSDLLAK